MDLKGFASGESLPAVRAHELGMVNVLAEHETVRNTAIMLAAKITANGPLVVAATKRIITESRGRSPAEMFAEQLKIAMPVFGSKDAKEVAVAFAEKHPPQWTGS